VIDCLCHAAGKQLLGIAQITARRVFMIFGAVWCIVYYALFAYLRLCGLLNTGFIQRFLLLMAKGLTVYKRHIAFRTATKQQQKHKAHKVSSSHTVLSANSFS
jgi:hypothetical protein